MEITLPKVVDKSGAGIVAEFGDVHNLKIKAAVVDNVHSFGAQ